MLLCFLWASKSDMLCTTLGYGARRPICIWRRWDLLLVSVEAPTDFIFLVMTILYAFTDIGAITGASLIRCVDDLSPPVAAVVPAVVGQLARFLLPVMSLTSLLRLAAMKQRATATGSTTRTDAFRHGDRQQQQQQQQPQEVEEKEVEEPPLTGFELRLGRGLVAVAIFLGLVFLVVGCVHLLSAECEYSCGQCA